MYNFIERQVEGQFHNCGDIKLIKEGKIAADLDSKETEF
jgi:hypothetical protein